MAHSPKTPIRLTKPCTHRGGWVDFCLELIVNDFLSRLFHDGMRSRGLCRTVTWIRLPPGKGLPGIIQVGHHSVAAEALRIADRLAALDPLV